MDGLHLGLHQVMMTLATLNPGPLIVGIETSTKMA